MPSNPYHVLGVSSSASPAEVKRAYRRKVRCSHPDAVGSGHEAEFRQVQEAYEAIKDRASAAPGRQRCASPASSPASHVRRPHGPAPLELELEAFEARRGLLLSFPLEWEVPCPVCGGHGLFSLFCGMCGGWGLIPQQVAVRVDVPPGVNDGDTIVGSADLGGRTIAIGLIVRIAGRREGGEPFGFF